MESPSSKAAPASAPLELVRVALVSDESHFMVVAKKDGERLAKTGRWKNLGPAEAPVIETKGRPGAPLEDRPVLAQAPPTSTRSIAGAVKVEPKEETKTGSGVSAFGEDIEG